jgi:hypothetical protein
MAFSAPEVQEQADKTTENTHEISVFGRWVRVPALHVDGKTIVVRGKLIKTAVIHDEEWLETEVADPERCVSRLKDRVNNPLHADIFTFTQKVPSMQPRYSYATTFDSIATAATIAFKDWWEKLPQESRKNVRRSQKRGVTVEVKKADDGLIQEIVELNNDNPVRQGRPYAHFGKSFQQVKKDQESFPDRSDYVCAYLGSELIGFLKLVYRADVASILQLLPKASHQDKRPANALLAKAVELCEAKGISQLIYGNFNYGNKRDSPLREFKVRNGFGEMLMPRYYIPLTAWGSLCMKLNVHRGLLTMLPHSMITLGVALRAKFNSSRRLHPFVLP